MLDKKVETEYNASSETGMAVNVNHGQLFNNCNVNHVVKGFIARLEDSLREEMKNEELIDRCIGELNYWLSPATDKEPMDLEMKLKLAGWNDENILKAERLKEKIYKIIDRYSSYPSGNRFFSHVLVFVLEKFSTFVYPKIKADASIDEINKTIHEMVIMPCDQLIQEGNQIYDLNLLDIRGMVYFLTGNCHLWFDKGNVS